MIKCSAQCHGYSLIYSRDHDILGTWHIHTNTEMRQRRHSIVSVAAHAFSL